MGGWESAFAYASNRCFDSSSWDNSEGHWNALGCTGMVENRLGRIPTAGESKNRTGRMYGVLGTDTTRSKNREVAAMQKLFMVDH